MVFSKETAIKIDEMAIVDVLTKLIFDADSVLNETEQLIIDLLIEINPSIKNTQRRDISEHLRSMGVDEMINVVADIKDRLEQQQNLIIATRSKDHSRIRR